MNTEQTKALKEYIKLLRDRAAARVAPLLKEEAEIKARLHDARIESNRDIKEANKIEKLISIQELADFCEQQEAEEAYELKNNHELLDQCK